MTLQQGMTHVKLLLHNQVAQQKSCVSSALLTQYSTITSIRWAVRLS